MKKDIIKSKYKECDFIVADKYGEGYILTLSEEEEIKGKDITIHAIPAYKFLLAGNAG